MKKNKTEKTQPPKNTSLRSNAKNGKDNPADKRHIPNKTLAEFIQPKNNIFPVIGIGASAGGLKPLQQFFESTPVNSGMAFVVILHLSPQHESHFAQILQNSTSMSVMPVRAETLVEPNKIYVISPSQHLTMRDGCIIPSEPERPFGRHVAIDLFFRTLAITHGNHSACVILSGTGSDGSIGLKRIKELGGVCLVQDPAEAEYDGMPRNAIATDMVDFVLPVAQIPAKLIDIWRNSNLIRLPEEAGTPLIDESERTEIALREVLTLLRQRTGHDFMHYKRATILRRIERRMQVTTTKDLPAYADHLRWNPSETQLLLKDLLIGVTNFFRDLHNFDTLAREVVPFLFQGKVTGDQVRVWCLGCSTGEEAYSLAILLLEYASQLSQPPEILIFASDIDEAGITTARAGSYPEAIEADVSPERLRSFFTKEAGGYLINQEVRDLVLFAHQNVIKDPPFSHLDLISCRNLLIYLGREVQKQVFDLFHFALRSGGFLFLGGSESVNDEGDLFETIDKKHRIFRTKRIEGIRRSLPSLPLEEPISRRLNRIMPNTGNNTTAQRERKHIALGELHQKFLEQYAPPSLILNSDYEILHMSENAGRYILHGAGEPSLNLLKVVLPDLRPELRSALFQALQSSKATEARRVRLTHNQKVSYVNMVARPVSEVELGKTYILVFFDEIEEALEGEGNEREHPTNEGEITTTKALRLLETELLQLREQLEKTVEKYETTVEELQAANEELQATNEELRSISEEHETSKEELQSVNEELRTVNQEMKNKIEEVIETNDDLKNLMSSTDIATIFLDRSLRIKRFTPRSLELFNLIPADEGRPLADFTHRLKYAEMVEDADRVLKNLDKIEREVESLNGYYYLARLVPYRTMSDRIEGVVLTFVDITERRRAEERLRLVIETAEDYAIMLLDAQGRYTDWNRGAARMFGYTAEEANGQPSSLIFTPEDCKLGVPEHELLTADQQGRVADERWQVSRNNTRIYVSGVLFALRPGRGYAKIARDLTQRKQLEDALIRAHDELEKRVRERTLALAEANVSLQEEVSERTAAEGRIKQLLRQLVTVQEEERRSIARELHDTLGQQLTALHWSIDTLKSKTKEHTGVQEDTERMESIFDRLNSDVDFLAWKLRPAALDTLGLDAVLQTFLREWSEHFDIAAEYKGPSKTAPRLAPEVETNLYRILQEALQNINKHAKATQVSVILECDEKQAKLIVEDNGRGYDIHAERIGDSKGMGITNMRERAALVGGEMEIESIIGTGTTIFIRVPLTAK